MTNWDFNMDVFVLTNPSTQLTRIFKPSFRMAGCKAAIQSEAMLENPC